MGYSIDGAMPPVIWKPGDPRPAWVDDPAIIVIAHNCLFEKAIWRRIMVAQYEWPNIPNSRWHDSMAVCAMKGIPMKLERAAVAMRLSEQTNEGHSRAVTAPSRPNKKGYYDRSEPTLQKVYTENAQDIRCEVELNHRMGGLQPCERPVWLLDQRINERGCGVDLDFVAQCQRVIDGATVPLVAEFRELTGGINPTQRDRVIEWVRKQGVAIPNLTKDTITKLLGAETDEEDDDDIGTDFIETPLFRLPDDVRIALDIRRKVGSASIKKLAAIQSSACADGRVRGVVQYHGAGPGRWVGRLFQPQNFPRGGTVKLDGKNADVDLVVSALMSGDHEYVEALFGDPFELVIGGLRHAIVPGPGRALVAGDYETVECRIVLALAGQHDKTAIIAAGLKPYIPMAEAIFKKKVDKEQDILEYTIGKNTVLGCGFQMGWETFRRRYCPDQSEEFARKAVNTYREEWAPLVPKVWYGLEEAACRAVWDHRPTEAYGIAFKHEDIWLTARLPSGRKLYYAYPLLVKKAMPWDETDIRPAWTSRTSKGGRFITRDMYGGLLTENVVQASARDLLTTAMFKCEKENLPVVLTVHDEIVCEPLLDFSDALVLKQIMEDRPQWAVEMGVPIGAGTWAGSRYKK